MKKVIYGDPADFLTPKEKAAFILIMVRMHTLDWGCTYQHPMTVSKAKEVSLRLVDNLRLVAPRFYRPYWGKVKQEMMKMNLEHEVE